MYRWPARIKPLWLLGCIGAVAPPVLWELRAAPERLPRRLIEFVVNVVASPSKSYSTGTGFHLEAMPQIMKEELIIEIADGFYLIH
jgi:hypothetical protein